MANGLPLFIDNTFATPALCRPIAHGADVDRCTRRPNSLEGTVVAIGGVIVENGTFPWDNGRFGAIVEPSRGVS